MTHSLRRPRRTHHLRQKSRHNGQVLLVAVVLMIVIAVLGSTCAALLVSAQLRPAPLGPSANCQTVAAGAPVQFAASA